MGRQQPGGGEAALGAKSQPRRQPLLGPAYWPSSALSRGVSLSTTRWALVTPTSWEQKTKLGEVEWLSQDPKAIRQWTQG